MLSTPKQSVIYRNRKIGWPYLEDTLNFPVLPEDKGYPKITIVTPSYNQGEFIEETILSVINQNYPNLEYIIIDGGSTDNTIEIIKKYEQHINWWVSEKDNGQSHAINKGFEMAKGQWGNWINSDDMLAKDALYNLADHLINAKPNTLFIGQCIISDKYRTYEKISTSSLSNFEELIDIRDHWRRKGGRQSIGQQNVMFNIDSYRKVGGLKVDNHFTMDMNCGGICC